MVNTGQASKGCATCKRRRIRCDASRPICQRCIKSNRICLGYTATQEHLRPPIAHQGTIDKNSAVIRARSSAIAPDPRSGISHARIKSAESAVSTHDLMVAHIDSNPHDATGPPLYLWESPELQKVARAVLDVVKNGLYTLQRQVQTREERKMLFAKYGETTGQLRKELESHMLSESTFLSVLLFSLYEMIVNIDSDDMTWQIHLDGLLNIIAISPVTRETAYLYRALQFVGAGDDMSKNISAIAVEKDPSAAYLLLDVTKLRLRQILPGIHELFEDSSKQPRKIDVQKIRVQVKKMHAYLDLFPVMMSGHEDYFSDTVHDIIVIRLNEYRTLQIMTVSFLLWSGDFLHATNDFHCTRDFGNLCTVVQDAARDIRSATEPCIHKLSSDVYKQGQAPLERFLSASMLLFPLYCASKAPCLAEEESQWFTGSLGLLGSRAFIPKASALVSEGAANDAPFRSCGWRLSYRSWSDVLAGLLLLNPALLNSPCRITGQSESAV